MVRAHTDRDLRRADIHWLAIQTPSGEDKLAELPAAITAKMLVVSPCQLNVYVLHSDNVYRASITAHQIAAQLRHGE